MPELRQTTDRHGRRILAAALGSCVHVAGIHNFLREARACGCATTFLGPAVPVGHLVDEIERQQPDVVAVSYRLTPAAAELLLAEFIAATRARNLDGREFIFGGTPPVVAAARATGFFSACFAGDDDDAVRAYLRGIPSTDAVTAWPDSLLERRAAVGGRPLLRHHFGRPSLAETVAGVTRIADARVLDIISLGPDQNAQASFFRPAEQNPLEDGAGGVPLRTPADLKALKAAAQTGNRPLLRCYSGTRDLLRWAPLLAETINNAWAAIPLYWYSELDGRSDRPLAAAISENQAAIRWHAERGIPVEVNEAHHWGLRGAHDTATVAAHYLAALNAKQAGVRTYIAQFMLNTPVGTSYPMDLAKFLAVTDLLSELESDSFQILRQVRTGLTSLATDPAVAKGQLISSLQLGLQLAPDIVHIVGFSEADHAANADEVIEAARMVQGLLRNTAAGVPQAASDPAVGDRRAELKREARVLLRAIARLGGGGNERPDDRAALTDPQTLTRAVAGGLLDAPQLSGRPGACGSLRTELIGGAWRAVDGDGRVIAEEERLQALAAAPAAGAGAGAGGGAGA